MLNRETAEPLYVQIHNILVDRLDANQYKANTMIPSESALCQEFGVSRTTLRSVITQLVQAGRLYRIQGKGTFVAEPKITADSTQYVGIREQLEQQGYEVRTEVLKVQIIEAEPAMAKKMELRLGEPVYKLERVRYVKDMPLSLHTSYIPVKYCEGLEHKDLKNEQLCVILSQDYHQVRAKVTETLESVTADAVESARLGIKRGSPLLLLCDKIYNVQGSLFEYSTVVFRGDRVKIRLQYEF